MAWWNDLSQWLDKPASNATVIVVAMLLGLKITKTTDLFNGRLSYLGSVLESIANGKPWP